MGMARVGWRGACTKGRYRRVTAPSRDTDRRERYVAADQSEVEVEDLYGRIEVPADWAEGVQEAVTVRSGWPPVP
jgi:hypothetical protein